MAFSNVIMYFIMLATASTLFPAGQTDINTAAEAAQALQPLVGQAAGLFFALQVFCPPPRKGIFRLSLSFPGVYEFKTL